MFSLNVTEGRRRTEGKRIKEKSLENGINMGEEGRK